MKKALVFLLMSMILLLSGCAGGGNEATAQPTEPPQQPRAKVYWNVDRAKYAEGSELTREKTDGYYTATFAIDGKQEILRFSKKALINYADTLDYMGFEFDEAGVVSKVLTVDEFTGGLAAYNLYVESVTEELILCNTLESFNGLPLKLYPNTNSGFYLLDESNTEKTGTPVTAEKGMQIIAIRDTQGFLLCAYLKQPVK